MTVNKPVMSVYALRGQVSVIILSGVDRLIEKNRSVSVNVLSWGPFVKVSSFRNTLQNGHLACLMLCDVISTTVFTLLLH